MLILDRIETSIADKSAPVVIHIIIYLLTICHAALALMFISYVLDD